MTEEKNSDNSHEYDSQVVLLSPPGLVVYRHLRRALTASALAQLDVLVDLQKQEFGTLKDIIAN